MIKRLVLFVSMLIGIFNIATCTPREKGKQFMFLYVGTYTENDAQCIELYRLNESSGKLTYLKTFGGIANPSYLRFSSDGRYLFAVNELVKWQGKPQGAVSAFKVKENGDLQLINQVASHGRAPCYLIVTPGDHFLLLNNYLNGTALSLTSEKDGRLGAPVSVIWFEGSGPNKQRQDASHVHSINLDPTHHFAVVADLGTDRLSVLAFDSLSGQLHLLKDKTVQTAPGAGPRHTVFSKDGKFLFVANELNNTVEVFSFEPNDGMLRHLQTVSTLPQDFTGTNYPADIHLSPDGKFLYVSNRGHESITIFSVREDGQLNFVGSESVRGSWPRNFTLSVDGRFLIVADQKSKDLVVFRRDAKTGLLTFLYKQSTMATPSCVKLASKIY